MTLFLEYIRSHVGTSEKTHTLYWPVKALGHECSSRVASETLLILIGRSQLPLNLVIDKGKLSVKLPDSFNKSNPPPLQCLISLKNQNNLQ
jgi:hypothetical protein